MDPIIDNRNPTTQTCRYVGQASTGRSLSAHRASVVRGFVGKNVILPTTGFHHVVGQRIALEDHETLVAGLNDQTIK